MATGLEAAATFVSILGFSAQCVNGLVTLKRALGDIQDAPRHLRKIRGDIDRLHRILLDLKQTHDAMGILGPPTPTLDDMRLDCVDAADDLEEVVSDLLNIIGKRRIPGAVRTVLQKDVVKKHQVRLDRIKQDLILAQTSFMAPRIGLLLHHVAAHRTITPHQISQVSQLIESETADTTPESTMPLQPSTSTITKWAPAKSKGLHMDHLRARAQRKAWTMQLTFKRLWSSAIKVQCEFSQGKFSFGATYHNILPCTAPVFDAVISGDVRRLQYMFDHRQASVYDVNERGWSLLDVSAFYMQIRYCSQMQIAFSPFELLCWYCRKHCDRTCLLDSECSDRDVAVRYSPRMVEFLISLEMRPTHHTSEVFWRGMAVLIDETSREVIGAEMARLLLSNSSHLLLEDASPSLCGSRPYAMTTIASASSQLLASVFPPYEEQSALDRWKNCWIISKSHFRVCSGVGTCGFPWLGSGGLTTSFVEDLGPYGCTIMLADIADGVAECAQQELRSSYRACLQPDDLELIGCLNLGLQSWHALLEAAVISGVFELANAVPCELGMSSSLRRLFSSMVVFEMLGSELRQTRQLLEIWLQILASAGIDLERYGCLEQTCLSYNNEWTLRCYSERYPELNSIRIAGMSIGGAVSDWRIWFHCPLDEWAADFWALIERESEHLVPGAWIDEREERQATWDAERRSETGAFKSLATSHRKRRRYLRFMRIDDAEASRTLGPVWDNMIRFNTEYGGIWNSLEDWPLSHKWVTKRGSIRARFDVMQEKLCQDCSQQADGVDFDLTTGEAGTLCWACEQKRELGSDDNQNATAC